MAVPSMPGAIGWAPQTIKGTAASGAYYWHKAREVNIQPVEIVRTFDPEIGGSLLPAGAYKGGYWTAGDMDLIPRLDEHLGWLLLSFAGSATVTGSGPYTHIFPGQADTIIPNKWLSMRRMIPKEDNSFFGETFTDCRVMGLQIAAVPGTVLTMRATVQGLGVTPNDNATGVGWAPTTDQGGYEPYQGAPLATASGFEMPQGTPIELITNVQLQMQMGAPNPTDEMVLGSYSPHAITPLSRSIQITATAFWTDAQMYKNLYYNNGAAWSPTLYTSYSPFLMSFRTPDNLSGLNYPGEIGFYAAANAILWRCEPINLRGGDVVVLRLTGFVVDTAGEDWGIYIKNGRSTVYA